MQNVKLLCRAKMKTADHGVTSPLFPLTGGPKWWEYEVKFPTLPSLCLCGEVWGFQMNGQLVGYIWRRVPDYFRYQKWKNEVPVYMYSHTELVDYSDELFLWPKAVQIPWKRYLIDVVLLLLQVSCLCGLFMTSI